MISEWLRRQGFVERSGEWGRFRDCGVESLDLVPVAAWGLSGEGDAVEQLFAHARPIPGFEHLFRPAPWHLLLALARRTVEGDGRLAAKHRSRIDAAVAEDAGAWEAARSAAPAWHAQRALAALKRAYETYGHASRSRNGARRWQARVRAVRGGEDAGARAGCGVLLEARRGRRRKRGQLISFSGLDGAGKSSQAEALQAGLERPRAGRRRSSGHASSGRRFGRTPGWAGSAGRLELRSERSKAFAGGGRLQQARRPSPRR